MWTQRKISARWWLAACFVASAWLCAYAVAADGFVVEGQVPPAVPEGATVEARLVGDDRSESEVTIASAGIEDGRFELRLPPEVDPARLETDRMGCEADDLLELAYLPYLVVVDDGEDVGQLLRTDVPRELWSFGGPPKHAYFLYTPDAFAVEGVCGGNEIAVSFEPGWNPVLVIQGTSGVSLTSEPAPDGYVWRFAPIE